MLMQSLMGVSQNNIESRFCAQVRKHTAAPSAKHSIHMGWGEHPEITHRRDERFPNRPLGVCHSQGAPLNPLRHQQHSLSTFVGANTQKSRIVVAKDSRKHASDVDSIRNNSMHSIIQRDMWHLRAATLANALAVFTSFWAQHGPFEGRDTCGSLNGFHIVLGAT